MAFDDGGLGGKYHLEEYKGKEAGLYKDEFGTVRVGRDGKVTFHKEGTTAPPIKPELPTVETPPVDPPTSPGERTGPNGIKQKGMTLGGVKNYLQGSGFELSDIGQLFELPSSFGVQTPAATETSPKPTASVPGTTGGNPADPQDGASSKPDETEAATEIKFDHPNGKQSDWMKPGSARNLAVQAFLDPKNKGYGAIKARNAAVGLADIPNQGLVARSGDNHYEYTGKGKTSDVAFDITGGKKGFIKHQDDFTLLESPESTPEPGTPAPDDEQTPAIIPTLGDITDMAQDFADAYKNGFKKK